MEYLYKWCSKYARGAVFVSLGLCSLAISGCISHPNTHPNKPKHILSSAEVDQSWAREGVVSVADRQHTRQLLEKIMRSKNIDDSDVLWLIALMHKPSTASYVNRITALSFFESMTAVTPKEHQEIRVAVAPLLTADEPGDTYHLVAKNARRMLNHLNQLNPSPR